MPIPNLQPEPLSLPIIVSSKNGKPNLMLRLSSTNIDIIKGVVSAAFHDKPIIVQPAFTDKLRSINSMMEKGILYREKENYYFSF